MGNAIMRNLTINGKKCILGSKSFQEKRSFSGRTSFRSKMAATTLAVVLGVSALGGSVQAVAQCSHPTLVNPVWVPWDYVQATGTFHNVTSRAKYQCSVCGDYFWVDEYKTEWEPHSYDLYMNGHCYCRYCGEEDEFYH